MRITFCGTAAGAHTAARASSGIVVQGGGHSIMLDCGSGSVREALKAGIDPAQLEAVLFSHLHHDHCSDLQLLVQDARFRSLALPLVIGPPGTTAFVASATAYVAATPMPRPPSLSQTLEIVEAGTTEIGGFAVRSCPTPHAPQVPAFARRLEIDGKAIVYTGDTQANPEGIVPLASGAVLLIHEAYSPDGLERSASARPPEFAERMRRGFATTHTEVSAAAAIAQEAGVSRLVLTHLVWGEDVVELKAIATQHFDGEVIVAYDGLVMEL